MRDGWERERFGSLMNMVIDLERYMVQFVFHDDPRFHDVVSAINGATDAVRVARDALGAVIASEPMPSFEMGDDEYRQPLFLTEVYDGVSDSDERRSPE